MAKARLLNVPSPCRDVCSRFQLVECRYTFGGKWHRVGSHIVWCVCVDLNVIQSLVYCHMHTQYLLAVSSL